MDDHNFRMERVARLAAHLEPPPARKASGWGYADTELYVGADGEVHLSGARYQEMFPADSRQLPFLRAWAEEKVGINVHFKSPAQTQPPAPLRPAAAPAELLEALTAARIAFTQDDAARRHYSHGHTLSEIYALRHGALERLTDVVAFPTSHEQCEALVRVAQRLDVCVVPYGGGTSVTGGVQPPPEEEDARCVLTVATERMARVLLVDRQNLLVTVQAGAVGADLQRALDPLGLVLGHEPDSFEFSSVGGWVATRASGMKRARYGNIEDLLVNARVVTPTGTLQRGSDGPRQSVGPDVLQMVLGSEGVLGLVTEVTLKVRPAPEAVRYNSLVFPSFDRGVACLRELAALEDCAPTSVRLMDPVQFQFGQAMKSAAAATPTARALALAKKVWVTRIKGFDPAQLCAATLLFEGSEAEVRRREAAVLAVAERYGALAGGEENGKRGYFLTYMIAYLRDFGLDHYLLSESFETSVPWGSVGPLCAAVKRRVVEAAAERGHAAPPFVCCRVTQSYSSGACIYFYVGLLARGLEDPDAIFDEVEAEAREEILANGGSLSHHHGVGRLRRRWMQGAVSEPGMRMLRGLKQALDPGNVFGAKNLL